MENQHQKIKGYRDLSQEEIDLMNRIKAHGEETAKLIKELYDMRDKQWASFSVGLLDNLTSDQLNDSGRALNIAKDHLQTGQMWLVRAVALPDSF